MMHLFITVMSMVPEAVQRAYGSAHPDLYEKRPGKPARLKAKGGTLRLGSLGRPGFAVGVDLDFKAMRPMPAAPEEKLGPANAAQESRIARRVPPPPFGHLPLRRRRLV